MDEQESRSDIAHTTLRSFVEGALATPRSEVFGLPGSGPAYFLAGLLKKTDETLFVLAPDQSRAALFAADLSFYHGHADEIFLLPHWEIRPYEPLTPHPEVESSRLSTLAALREGRARAVVLTPRALMQRMIPGTVLDSLCEHLVLEGEYPRESLLRRLLDLGYASVPLVEDRGTFSVRGDLLDIFPPSRDLPVRIEFFGDWIERMRPFDSATQRSKETELESLFLLPAREMVLAGNHLETFSRRIKERCDALGLPRSSREVVLEEAREGILSPGRAFLLPYNYDGLDTFFDYAGQGVWAALAPPDVESEIDRFAAEIRDGERRMAEKGDPFAPAQELFLSPDALDAELGRSRRIDFSGLEVYRLRDDRRLFRVNAEGNGDIRSGLLKEGGG